jgi:hypothetical protein
MKRIGPSHRLRHGKAEASTHAPAKAPPPEKIEGAVLLGSPYPLDKLMELLDSLESRQFQKALRAAIEIIENYSRVARAVAKTPDLNMSMVNGPLNRLLEANTEKIIAQLLHKTPPAGLNFLANSSAITSEAVRQAAREALARQHAAAMARKGASHGGDPTLPPAI